MTPLDAFRGPAGPWLITLIVRDPEVRNLLHVLASRDLDARNVNGLAWPAGARDALDALKPSPVSVVSASGQSSGSVRDATGLVTAAVAERLTGKTNVRRMCRTGEVIGHRDGRDWLVDLDSLRSVLARRAS